MALQREIKISNLITQREFIKEQLEKVKNMNDGDPTYSYTGYIYPENIRYFEEIEGCVITKVESDMAKAFSKGKIVYCFMPKDDIVLTDEELQSAEEVARKKKAEDAEEKANAEEFGSFMELLAGRRPSMGFGGPRGLF